MSDPSKTATVIDHPSAPATDTRALVRRPMPRTFSLVPESMGQAMEMARMIAASDFAPKDYVNKPGNVLVAIQMGLDLGLKPMQSLQNIAVINGRPSIWGDAALALVQNSDVIEWVTETIEGTKNADGSFPDTYTRVCSVKRVGWPEPVIRHFSVADAKKAELWTKKGTWQNYPDRMLQMRARSFALRDAAADCLMGLVLAEEAQDYPTVEGTATVVAAPDVPAPDIFLKVPESSRDNVEKAFALLDLPKGLRLVKLNEFLGPTDVDPELGTQSLLNWCRDEYAARQGKQRAPGPQNSKAPAASGGAVKTGVDPSLGASDARPATAETPKGAPSEASAPLTAKDIKFGF